MKKIENAPALNFIKFLREGSFDEIEHAFGELIDNSKSAASTKIHIILQKDLFEIVDNGLGMNQKNLDAATNLGKQGSNHQNNMESLYGSGGYASCLYLGNEVNVITKNNKNYYSAKQDFVKQEKEKKWSKFIGRSHDQDIKFLENWTKDNYVDDFCPSTIIQIKKLCKLEKIKVIEDRLTRYIARTYHQFLEDGNSIIINNQEVIPYNPIFKNQPQTIDEGTIVVSGNKIDYSIVKNIPNSFDTINKEQGIYLYLNQRCLIGGLRLGLYRMESLTNGFRMSLTLTDKNSIHDIGIKGLSKNSMTSIKNKKLEEKLKSKIIQILTRDFNYIDKEKKNEDKIVLDNVLNLKSDNDDEKVNGFNKGHALEYATLNQLQSVLNSETDSYTSKKQSQDKKNFNRLEQEDKKELTNSAIALKNYIERNFDIKDQKNHILRNSDISACASTDNSGDLSDLVIRFKDAIKSKKDSPIEFYDKEIRISLKNNSDVQRHPQINSFLKHIHGDNYVRGSVPKQISVFHDKIKALQKNFGEKYKGSKIEKFSQASKEDKDNILCNIKNLLMAELNKIRNNPNLVKNFFSFILGDTNYIKVDNIYIQGEPVLFCTYIKKDFPLPEKIIRISEVRNDKFLIEFETGDKIIYRVKNEGKNRGSLLKEKFKGEAVLILNSEYKNKNCMLEFCEKVVA